MHAMRYHGKPELRLEEVDVLPLKKGEVRVKVAFCGVCHPKLVLQELRYSLSPIRPFRHLRLVSPNPSPTWASSSSADLPIISAETYTRCTMVR